MKVAIVAGGLGSRMVGLTNAVPKSMLEVLGKPILEHLIVWLAASGMSDISLCLGYRSEAVAQYFENGEKWGVNLNYHIEKAPRGTAGCVLDLIQNSTEDVLVVYGDLFIEMDIKPFLKFHADRSKAAASLVLFATDHPQDSDLVQIEGDHIVGFYRDSKAEAPHHLACSAVWAIRKSLLDLIPNDRPSDFGRDIFPEAIRRCLELACYVTKERLLDLGTPERLRNFAASGNS